MARKTIGVRQSADPAAGAELVFTADEDMIVYSVAFTLVTDATVVNRFIELHGDDGTNDFFVSANSTAQTATQTVQYSAFAGSVHTAGVPRNIQFPTNGLRLRKGDRLRTNTLNKAAGDNYGVMSLQVERPHGGFEQSVDFVDA